MGQSSKIRLECDGYRAGHPWYFQLGGSIPTPKQIQAYAIASDYRGYKAADIENIDKKAEPKRSQELRYWKCKFTEDIRSDLSCYREVVRELRQYRQDNQPTERPNSCSDIHTAMSLKYAHLFNDFAHLDYLDELLSKQGDLFDL